MVLCNELGHHLAGFPFVQAWAANEGQSDIFATSACAALVFGKNTQLVNLAKQELPQEMIEKCNAAHSGEESRGICYRSLLAGKSLADLLGALKNQTVAFNTPDTSEVSRTNNSHPDAQCRLDTYVAGALCGASQWDNQLIPGKEMVNRNSVDAQGICT